METLNLFDLFARIILDTSDYDDNLDEASRNTESFANKLKNGLSTAAKVGAAALTAAATGVAALTKASLDQYAEYEQLVGGVETLFKSSADTVQQYAANAYQTAGVSANTYMQQATAFSASLIQSLGGDTQAAAEYANQAIMDMSDNANKMGTNIESIQQTYQSLMRGNYEMLDNLKLGYGGTKAELERLVADAEKLTGQALDPAKFSDVITAIHAVQENLGITGTTAQEAASTIEGSVNMTKAAWSNLLTGIADDNANLEVLIDNFVSSVETAAGNIVPRVTQILSGLGTAIEQLAPIIAQELPAMISSALPSLISAGAQLLVGLVTGLVSALPQLAAQIPQIASTIYNSIIKSGPQLLDAGSQLLSMLVNGIVNGLPRIANASISIMTSFGQYLQSALPTIIPAAMQALLTFSSSLRSNVGLLVDGALGMIQAIANGIIQNIPILIQTVPQIVTNIAGIINDNAPKLVETAFSIIGQLAMGLIQAIPTLVANIPQIIQAIVAVFTAYNWLDLGRTIITALKNGMIAMVGAVQGAAGNILNAINNTLKSLPSNLLNLGKQGIQGLINGIKSLLGSISSVMSTVANTILNGLKSLPGEMVNIAKQIINGLINGIKSGISGVASAIGDMASSAINKAKSALGIASPSKVFTEIGKYTALGFEKGWSKESENIKSMVDGDLKFDTASVDFSSSGLGISSAGIVNGLSSVQQSGGTYTFNLILPDGTKLASYMLKPLADYARANGTPILNPT